MMFGRRRASDVHSAIGPGDRLSLQPTVKDVVFAHIPKTAGTSIRNMLVAALPDAVKVFDYGANTDQIPGEFINAFTGDVRTPEGLIALRGQFGRTRRVMVSGHIVARKYLEAFHPASFVTFLRDPIDRIVSAYKHHVRHLGFKGSFSEFYQQPGQINTHARILWGLDLAAIGFIGLSEMMPDMIAALSRHLGVELRDRKDNVSSRFDAPTITESDRARITALNDDDIRLYRHVEANLDSFTNYGGRAETGPALATGTVNRRDDLLFHGWASVFHPGRLAEVEVRLGMQVVHRCYADQFLPFMKNRNPHGVGGFSVRLPEAMLAGHSQVRFVVAGTEKDLEGSPIAL
jgi:hypothetical protein